MKKTKSASVICVKDNKPEMQRRRKSKRYVNLKPKNKLKVILYNRPSEISEPLEERLRKLNEELDEIWNQYYSSKATAERIMKRNLFCLIQTVFYEHKKR